MKAAYSLFSFAQDADFAACVELVARAGYAGVEPVLSENGYLTPRTTDEEILAMGRLARQHGLAIPTLGVWSLWEHNLLSDDAAVRQKARDIIRFQLHAARLLGADTILVVPGYVETEFASKPEVIPYDVAYRRAVEAFRALAADAAREGVRIGMENVWNGFLLSPLETARLVDEVGSEWFGVYFDVGNVMHIGLPQQWIEILGKRIFKIHLSDYRRGQAGLGAFVDLFAGDVDFKAVAAALRGIGYDDWLTLEMLPNYRQFPEVSPFSNKYAVDKIVRMCEENHTE